MCEILKESDVLKVGFKKQANPNKVLFFNRGKNKPGVGVLVSNKRKSEKTREENIVRREENRVVARARVLSAGLVSARPHVLSTSRSCSVL